MIEEFNHLLLNIRDYLSRFKFDEGGLRSRMRHQARADEREHWIVPVEVGAFLRLLVRVTGARRIFEVGSYLGYSATCFADGLPSGGLIYFTEQDDLRYAQAEAFLRNSGYEDRIRMQLCDGVTELANAQEEFDIILIDHDKPDYCRAYEVARGRVRVGGLIVADNVLWRRRIVDSDWAEDPSTRGVLEFNEMIHQDEGFDTLIVPIGDGVSLSCRIR